MRPVSQYVQSRLAAQSRWSADSVCGQTSLGQQRFLVPLVAVGARGPTSRVAYVTNRGGLCSGASRGTVPENQEPRRALHAISGDDDVALHRLRAATLHLTCCRDLAAGDGNEGPARSVYRGVECARQAALFRVGLTHSTIVSSRVAHG